MKNIVLRSISLIICLFMVIALYGCNASTNTPVENASSAAEQTADDTLPDDLSSTPEETPTQDMESNEDGYVDSATVESDPITDTEEENSNSIYEIKAKIHNANPLSTKYMGSGTGVYYCYSYMPDSVAANATDAQIAYEMDRLENMGIHTVRTLFNFSWARDEASPTGWNWESDDMKAVYRWLGEMQKRNIDVIINPWNFMWLYNGVTSIPDSDYFRTDDFTENSKRWCHSVTLLFKQLYSRGYSNAKYLMLFTEPIYESDKSEDIYNCYVQNAKRLHTALVDTGLRSKVTIIGPNRNDDDTDLLEKCINEADEAFDIYSQHRYLRAATIVSDTYYDDGIEKYGNFTRFMDSTKAKDKPFWIDEFGIQDASLDYSNVGEDNPFRGLQMAVGITAAMNLGVDNVLVWALADQKWPDNEGTSASSGFEKGVAVHGMLGDIRFTSVPKSQYYSYSLLSKYCGRHNGKTYYSAPYSDYEYMGVTLGCVQTSTGDWTIIITNNNYEETKISVDIEKSLGGAKLFRHQYVAHEVVKNTAGQIIPANKTIKNVTTSFTDILRPCSVAVYTTIKG